MSLPESTTVLIVGAGPAGLATALSLVHHGFRDFVIVDALAQGQNVSRALVVHAATLEALTTIGCADEIVSKGVQSSSLSIGTRSSMLLSPRIESLKAYTKHPYILFITQNVVERILEKKVTSSGVTVHRSLRVVGLRRNADNPQISDVTLEDGRIIRAKYVIGADGARSVVRAMAGIGFADPEGSEAEANNALAQMALADITLENVSSDTKIQTATLAPDNLFLCFPLPPSFNESLATEGRAPATEKVYRIGCGVPLDEGEVPHAPSKEYIQNLLDRFGPYQLTSDRSVNKTKPVHIKNVVWSSRFRTRSAIADTTFTRLGSGASSEGDGGVILLIGDAAHIHSPAGGQGMNLGLRDAIFLGQALTEHIRATETQPVSQTDAILRDFAASRHARAAEVIQLTKGILSVAGMKHRKRYAWWLPLDSATVRAWCLWVLGFIPFVKNRMAWELSGLSRR